MTLLPRVEIDPASDARSSVIWLHGLGADGNDFAPIVPELDFPEDAGIRFIFPHAPSMPVTINNGMVMPAWYDILEMSINRSVDIESLKQSAARIESIFNSEIERGIPSERIVLAGFSQGGAVAYQLGLNLAVPIAGIMALSTYMASPESIQFEEVNKDIPILICHGSSDPVVPEFLGKNASQTLSERGYKTHYKTYQMEHSVCAAEIADISQWLQEVLP